MTFGLMIIFLVLSTLSSTDGACVKTMDIAVVFDGSASVGFSNFKSIQEFLIGIVREIDVGPERMCLIRVRREPSVEFDFNNHSSTLELEMAVSEQCYSRAVTDMEDSLKLAADKLFDEEAGARPQATKILIVFSDGDFNPFSLDSRLDEVNVLAVRSGQAIYKDLLMKKLVKDSRDFFTITDNKPANVIARMRDLAQDSCV